MARDDRFDDLGDDDGPGLGPDGPRLRRGRRRLDRRGRGALPGEAGARSSSGRRGHGGRRSRSSFSCCWCWGQGSEPQVSRRAGGSGRSATSGRPPTDSPTCGAPTPVAALPADTTVVVLNATDVRGLATAIGEALTAARFQGLQVGNEDDAIEVPRVGADQARARVAAAGQSRCGPVRQPRAGRRRPRRHDRGGRRSGQATGGWWTPRPRRRPSPRCPAPAWPAAFPPRRSHHHDPARRPRRRRHREARAAR